MSVKIYNTLSRKKEPFVPIEEGKVSMYVCGPTVYNYIHIGNARPPIVFDTVRRYLEYRGYDVKYVMNFTDVDDKIINAAKEMGEDVYAVAEKFIQAYKEDTSALGVKEGALHPRVTESMEEIIDFVQGLIDKGYAYVSEGDVYFRTRSFDGYGKLSHQSIDELRSGARIRVGEQKDDPLDFALWKNAKPGEISWDTPWGKGRPGWHIECSAMVKKHLGDTIDIHAGGTDLTFPHHENEIAQSEALNGKSFANYWMHNGHINIDNEKMSKSLGNFILAHDLIKKHDPQVLRFFMLSVHYRNPINFTDELLESAKSGLARIKNAYDNLQHRKAASTNQDSSVKEVMETIQELIARFEEEMDDDFNTANAVSVLFDLAREANVYLQQEQTSEQVIEAFTKAFEDLGGVLGVTFAAETELLDDEIEDLLAQRVKARKNRDFQEADRIRDLLKEKNIILEDTSQGTRWKRG
ncbi:cysteinyl-tRNA synthetase [Terribacillus halophilus]|uniref:Cysteine--tRNA ligase n=1 Tax=Terribacillus halophilus TaxID=361279 RepID=A0A1G6W0R6_9BACI|nr:cysteine--tRNA ligase [Terribacillus halophilus]SDD59482.1 cysteinyl-tRNA synthetase [Terribacillus halophilus]